MYTRVKARLKGNLMQKASLIFHEKYGLVYVAGYKGDRISVKNIKTGERLAQNIKVSDCKFLSYNTWKIS